MKLSASDKSSEEKQHDDDARLNWLLRAEARDIGHEELSALSGMPEDRVISALQRLSGLGLVHRDESNQWRVSRYVVRRAARR